MGRTKKPPREAWVAFPVPPSANARLIPGQRRFVLSKKYREFKAHAKQELLLYKYPPYTGDVEVTMTWYRGQKRGDIDGRIKPILDVMQGSVYKDDTQVSTLIVKRSDTEPKNPRMVVRVRPDEGT